MISRWYTSVKVTFFWLIGKPIEKPKPPINLTKIIIHTPITRYQNRSNRPGWVNDLFNDYIKGKIPSLSHLKNEITVKESYQYRRNTL